ncbi:MAG: hypothetical protein K2X27_16415 [Candidatus Obscuribacterales bacterium]|nr:hypothetical protein [Candidatus Obscuribacterales bacterium]
MNEMDLTDDERRCLRMWFRQAIAHVEMEEAKRALLSEHAGSSRSSHSKFAGRRTRRSRLTAIVKQMA